MITPYFNKRISSIIIPVSTTREFRVYGKSFFKVTNVYLSGHPYTSSTIQNPFSAVPKLSAAFPSFTGVRLLTSDYEVSEDNNYLVFTMPSATRAGFVDVIVENPAGYGKLTQFVIKELYGTNLTNLELRPWSSGIIVSVPEISSVTLEAEVLSAGIITINDEYLVTIAGEYIVQIQNLSPIETFYLITDNNQILITNTNDKIIYGS